MYLLEEAFKIFTLNVVSFNFDFLRKPEECEFLIRTGIRKHQKCRKGRQKDSKYCSRCDLKVTRS